MHTNVIYTYIHTYIHYQVGAIADDVGHLGVNNAYMVKAKHGKCMCMYVRMYVCMYMC